MSPTEPSKVAPHLGLLIHSPGNASWPTNAALLWVVPSASPLSAPSGSGGDRGDGGGEPGGVGRGEVGESRLGEIGRGDGGGEHGGVGRGESGGERLTMFVGSSSRSQGEHCSSCAGGDERRPSQSEASESKQPRSKSKVEPLAR